jgi:hypothetical protein
LSKEYFEGNKRGRARAFITHGSATTNNALESFNGNVLAKDTAAGSRMTIAQRFEQLDGLFSIESAAGPPPITPIDIRECVRAKPHMKTRVKDWYAKAVELGIDWRNPQSLCTRLMATAAFTYCPLRL